MKTIPSNNSALLSKIPVLAVQIICDVLYVTGSEKTRHICQTRIWRNARFLVSPVQKYESPVLVIFVSKNLSTNSCHRLLRVNIS